MKMSIPQAQNIHSSNDLLEKNQIAMPFSIQTPNLPLANNTYTNNLTTIEPYEPYLNKILVTYPNQTPVILEKENVQPLNMLQYNDQILQNHLTESDADESFRYSPAKHVLLEEVETLFKRDNSPIKEQEHNIQANIAFKNEFLGRFAAIDKMNIQNTLEGNKEKEKTENQIFEFQSPQQDYYFGKINYEKYSSPTPDKDGIKEALDIFGPATVFEDSVVKINGSVQKFEESPMIFGNTNINIPQGILSFQEENQKIVTNQLFSVPDSINIDQNAWKKPNQNQFNTDDGLKWLTDNQIVEPVMQNYTTQNITAVPNTFHFANISNLDNKMSPYIPSNGSNLNNLINNTSPLKIGNFPEYNAQTFNFTNNQYNSTQKQIDNPYNFFPELGTNNFNQVPKPDLQTNTPNMIQAQLTIATNATNEFINNNFSNNKALKLTPENKLNEESKDSNLTPFNNMIVLESNPLNTFKLENYNMNTAPPIISHNLTRSNSAFNLSAINNNQNTQVKDPTYNFQNAITQIQILDQRQNHQIQSSKEKQIGQLTTPNLDAQKNVLFNNPATTTNLTYQDLATFDKYKLPQSIPKVAENREKIKEKLADSPKRSNKQAGGKISSLSNSFVHSSLSINKEQGSKKASVHVMQAKSRGKRSATPSHYPQIELIPEENEKNKKDFNPVINHLQQQQNIFTQKNQQFLTTLSKNSSNKEFSQSKFQQKNEKSSSQPMKAFYLQDQTRQYLQNDGQKKNQPQEKEESSKQKSQQDDNFLYKRSREEQKSRYDSFYIIKKEGQLTQSPKQQEQTQKPQQPKENASNEKYEFAMNNGFFTSPNQEETKDTQKQFIKLNYTDNLSSPQPIQEFVSKAVNYPSSVQKIQSEDNNNDGDDDEDDDSMKLPSTIFLNELLGKRKSSSVYKATDSTPPRINSSLSPLQRKLEVLATPTTEQNKRNNKNSNSNSKDNNININDNKNDFNSIDEKNNKNENKGTDNKNLSSNTKAEINKSSLFPPIEEDFKEMEQSQIVSKSRKPSNNLKQSFGPIENTNVSTNNLKQYDQSQQLNQSNGQPYPASILQSIEINKDFNGEINTKRVNRYDQKEMTFVEKNTSNESLILVPFASLQNSVQIEDFSNNQTDSLSQQQQQQEQQQQKQQQQWQQQSEQQQLQQQQDYRERSTSKKVKQHNERLNSSKYINQNQNADKKKEYQSKEKKLSNRRQSDKSAEFSIENMKQISFSYENNKKKGISKKDIDQQNNSSKQQSQQLSSLSQQQKQMEKGENVGDQQILKKTHSINRSNEYKPIALTKSQSTNIQQTLTIENHFQYQKSKNNILTSENSNGNPFSFEKEQSQQLISPKFFEAPLKQELREQENKLNKPQQQLPPKIQSQQAQQIIEKLNNNSSTAASFIKHQKILQDAALFLEKQKELLASPINTILIEDKLPSPIKSKNQQTDIIDKNNSFKDNISPTTAFGTFKFTNELSASNNNNSTNTTSKQYNNISSSNSNNLNDVPPSQFLPKKESSQNKNMMGFTENMNNKLQQSSENIGGQKSTFNHELQNIKLITSSSRSPSPFDKQRQMTAPQQAQLKNQSSSSSSSSSAAVTPNDKTKKVIQGSVGITANITQVSSDQKDQSPNLALNISVADTSKNQQIQITPIKQSQSNKQQVPLVVNKNNDSNSNKIQEKNFDIIAPPKIKEDSQIQPVKVNSKPQTSQTNSSTSATVNKIPPTPSAQQQSPLVSIGVNPSTISNEEINKNKAQVVSTQIQNNNPNINSSENVKRALEIIQQQRVKQQEILQQQQLNLTQAQQQLQSQMKLISNKVQATKINAENNNKSDVNNQIIDTPTPQINNLKQNKAVENQSQPIPEVAIVKVTSDQKKLFQGMNFREAEVSQTAINQKSVSQASELIEKVKDEILQKSEQEQKAKQLQEEKLKQLQDEKSKLLQEEKQKLLQEEKSNLLLLEEQQKKELQKVKSQAEKEKEAPKAIQIQNRIQVKKVLASSSDLTHALKSPNVQQYIPAFQSPRKDQILFNNFFKKENFRVGKLLGSGKFSEVYMAMDIYSGLIVALKKIKKQVLIKYKSEDYLDNEIKIQTVLNHPNILKLYGFYYDAEFVYLVQEFASHGELYHDLKRQPNERFDEIKGAAYMRQVVDAFTYMHRFRVIHRDIKPENILISFGVLKIADFGCSVYCPEDRRDTFCGTIDYISPEIASGEGYGQSVDLWSLGILVYELLTGKSPFQYETKKEILQNIMQVNIQIPNYLSEEAQDFMKGLLVKDPSQRMTMEQVSNHKWIRENLNKYSQITWDNKIAKEIMTFIV